MIFILHLQDFFHVSKTGILLSFECHLFSWNSPQVMPVYFYNKASEVNN